MYGEKLYTSGLGVSPRCPDMAFSNDNRTIIDWLTHGSNLAQPRPFPRSLQSLFQSESYCKIFAMIIGSNFNMNEN